VKEAPPNERTLYIPRISAIRPFSKRREKKGAPIRPGDDSVFDAHHSTVFGLLIDQLGERLHASEEAPRAEGDHSGSPGLVGGVHFDLI